MRHHRLHARIQRATLCLILNHLIINPFECDRGVLDRREDREGIHGGGRGVTMCAEGGARRGDTIRRVRKVARVLDNRL
jgi:hypothetical protein